MRLVIVFSRIQESGARSQNFTTSISLKSTIYSGF
jgi:hypothetical protein